MRILVLGASNEIINPGYIYNIQQATSIVNLSIGGSSSTAGVYSLLNQKEPTSTEFTIISYELNEHGIVQFGLRSLHDVKENLNWIITQSLSRSSIPLISLLPRLENNRITRTSTCDIHAEIAKNNNIPHIDIAKIFLELQSKGVDPFQLMRDGAHMAEIPAKIIGECLGDYLSTLKKISWNIKPVTKAVADFKLYKITTDQSRFPTTTRKSSLNASNLTILKKGDTAAIQAQVGDDLLGIIANRMSWPGGSLRIGSTIKNIWYPDSKKDGYMKSVIDLRPIPCDAEGKFVFSIEHKTRKPSEPTWLSIATDTNEQDEPVVEIESFIARGQHPRTSLTGIITTHPGFQNFAESIYGQCCVREICGALNYTKR